MILQSVAQKNWQKIRICLRRGVTHALCVTLCVTSAPLPVQSDQNQRASLALAAGSRPAELPRADAEDPARWFQSERPESLPNTGREAFMAGLARDLQRFGESVNAGREAEESRAIVIDRILEGLRASAAGLRTQMNQNGGSQPKGDTWSTFSGALKQNLQQAGWATLEATGSGLLKGQPAHGQGDALAIAGLRAGLDAGAATLRAHDPFGLAHLELSYGVENTDTPSWSVLAVKPLYESTAKDRVAFAQVGLTREDDDTTYNGGLAARLLTPDRQWLVGPNAFLDYTTRLSHTRFSLGLDARSERMTIAANRYFALKDWKDSRFGYEERALSGYDVEVGGRLPQMSTVELFARQFFWWRDGDENIVGQEYALEYTPVPLLRTRVAFVDTDGGPHEASVKTQLTYRFGVPLKDQLRAPDPGASDLLDRRFEKVRRENTIRTQERLKGDVQGSVIETVGANTITTSNGSTALVLSATVTPPATLSIANTPGAIARIRFGDGGILTLGQNTTVTVDIGRITLVTGILQYVSGSGVPHVITVPGGSINLLGTDVDVRVADGGSTVRVRSGAIRVEGTGGTQTASVRGMVGLSNGVPTSIPETAPAYETHANDASEKLDLATQTRTDPKVAPYVVQAPSRTSGGDTVGQTVRFTVTYSKPIVVSGGTPYLRLTINGAPRTAALVEGTGTTSLIFAYTLTSSDIGAATAVLTNIDRNGAELASDGEVAVTTFNDTSVTLTGNGSAIIPDDTTAPIGYGVAFTTSPVNAANQTAAAFVFSGAEVGASFAYSITSSGGAGTVSGTGTIATTSQAVSGLNLSSLPNGTLTVSVILTDTSGNSGATVTGTVVKNALAPTFTLGSLAVGNQSVVVTFNEPVYTNANATGALTVADFTASVSAGPATVSIASVSHTAGATSATLNLTVTGVPAAQTLTISAASNTLFNALGNASVHGADIALNSGIDCSDPAVLSGATIGARCTDGSIYAGNLSGTYLITHVSGCGHEPSGTSSTKPTSSFTPTCSGGADSISKRWANSISANEGATSLTDGLANTNQLIADTQRLNPAAAYCYHLNLHGKTDWFLPARDELNVLYLNRTAIARFASAGYWSSSENNSGSAWRHGFNDGLQASSNKANDFSVRCVRRAN